MFTVNLRNYVFRDNRRRLRDDRISLLIALASSMLMLALGQPERTAAIAGLVVLGVSMFGLTLHYCSSAPQIAARFRQVPSVSRGILYRPVSRRLAWASVVVLLALVPLPEVEAAILDKRLQKLIQTVPLSRGSIDEISQTLHKAYSYGVRPGSSTASTVQEALKKTSDLEPTLSYDAINAAAVAASVAASTGTVVDIGQPPDMHGPLYRNVPNGKDAAYTLIPIATNTAPDSYSIIGFAQRPDVARMERIGSPISISEYGPATWLVKGMTATLDGWHLKHIIFQDMKLIYQGGPLVLESVYFFRCQLECVPSENSWRLLSAVSNGGWVSLSVL